MLRLNNVQVIYSDVILVLKGLSLDVEEGKIVALLGANGAGKTTTLKAISGLLKTEDGEVTDGSIEFMGRRIDGRDPEAICRLGIVQVMEGRKVLESMTVEENLRIGGYSRRDAGRSPPRHADDLRATSPGWWTGGPARRLPVGRRAADAGDRPRPHGQAAAAAARRALARPRAPAGARDLRRSSRRSTASGARPSCSSSRTPRSRCGIADYGYIMENGRIVFEGAAEKLRGNDDVREFYLGLSAAGRRKSFREVKFYKRRKRWAF